jgi:ElaB/YqjD/DUF883 family membrane-anchored ribosome-binding protein
MEQVLDDPKINEALELLNSSAKEKKEQLQRLISDRYANIRGVMENTSGAVSAAANNTRNIVKRNPWPFLGGVAALFLAAGYFIGSSRD